MTPKTDCDAESLHAFATTLTGHVDRVSISELIGTEIELIITFHADGDVFYPQFQ